MTGSNAVPKQLKPFAKGDPRINRKGRPKSFDALRALSQQIAHELAIKDGEPLIIAGHKVTIAEAILRQWAMSKNPILQRAFLEIAFGKVPDQLDLKGQQIIKILVEYGNETADTSSD